MFDSDSEDYDYTNEQKTYKFTIRAYDKLIEFSISIETGTCNNYININIR